MKKLISIIVILTFCMCFIGCGDTKIIDGIEYDTYGLINSSDKKNPDIEYRVIVGNVMWSAILVETVIAPIYFIGFSLMEPVSKKNQNKVKGEI